MYSWVLKSKIEKRSTVFFFVVLQRLVQAVLATCCCLPDLEMCCAFRVCYFHTEFSACTAQTGERCRLGFHANERVLVVWWKSCGPHSVDNNVRLERLLVKVHLSREPQ